MLKLFRIFLYILHNNFIHKWEFLLTIILINNHKRQYELFLR